MTASLFLESGATFSPCSQYRYRLWRTWDPQGLPLNAILLNPSTADASRNDPTVTRLVRRAEAWGYGSLVVTNLFALRATDPRELRAAADPVGPENDQRLLEAAHATVGTVSFYQSGRGMVLVGWGRWGGWQERAAQVLAMLRKGGIPVHCLRIGADGSPCHPLYLPYSLAPQPFGVQPAWWAEEQKSCGAGIQGPMTYVVPR